MELSKQLDQKWKELKALREEMVLIIRKAFTFEDSLSEDLMLGAHDDKGFGLVSTGPMQTRSYILTYPDIVIGRIRVVYRFTWQPVEGEVYIDCISDLQEAEKSLRRLILGFLVSFDTGGEIAW